MRTTRKTLAHLLTVAASAVLMLTALAAPSTADTAGPAATGGPLGDDLPEIGEVFDPGGSVTASTCAESWCWSSDADWDDEDTGGKWAWARLTNAFDSTEFYQVYFEPLGERLIVWDRFSDGHEAHAEVVVTVPYTSVVLDRDTNLYTGYDGDFDLGTPDGTGDIAEGLNVSVRVCVGDTGMCSPWITGRA